MNNPIVDPRASSAHLLAGILLLAGCSTNPADASGAGGSNAGPVTSASTNVSTSAASGAGGGGGDATGVVVERKATLAFAASDLPPQYVCFLGFKPAADGSPQGDPVAARGPWGIPDPTDPNLAATFGKGELGLPVKLTGGFPYGAMVPLSIRKRDAPFFDELAGIVITVTQVDSAVFAGNGVDSMTCRAAWAAAVGQQLPRIVTKPGTIKVGESWLAGISGCAMPSTDPQCAGGNNLTITELVLDGATPATFTGSGDTKVAIQVAHLAAFAGYQGVDLYIQPMLPAPDGGAAPVPDGAPLPISTQGVSWTQITLPAAGVQLEGANRDLALFLLVKHGDAPFCGGMPACQTTVAIPIKPFLDKYATTAGAAWSGNQTFVLFGRPPLGAGEKPADFLRLGIFSDGF